MEKQHKHKTQTATKHQRLTTTKVVSTTAMTMIVEVMMANMTVSRVVNGVGVVGMEHVDGSEKS